MFKRLLASPIAKLTAENSYQQLAARIIVSATGFILTILIARTMGAGAFGDYVIATSYIPFFYLLSDAGFNALYIRDAGVSKKAGIGAFAELFSARLLLSLIVFIFALVGIIPLSLALPQLGNRALVLAIILAPAIVSQAILTSCNAEFQKQLSYVLQTRAVFAGSAVTLLMSLAALLLPEHLRLPGIIIALVAGSWLTALKALYLVRRLIGKFSFSLSFSGLRRYISAALPLLATLVLNVAYFKIDTYLLSYFSGQTAVGIYGYAYKFFEFLLVVPTFAMNSLYPLLVTRAGEGKPLLSGLHLKKIIFVFAGLSGVTIAAGLLISLALPFTGPEYLGSGGVLRILSAGLPLFFGSSLAMWLLIIKKMHRELVVIYLLGFTLNVVLNLKYVPGYSYLAAAWVTVATELLITVLSWSVLVKKEINHG